MSPSRVATDASTSIYRGKEVFEYDGRRYDVNTEKFRKLLNSLRKADVRPFTTIRIGQRVYALNPATSGKGSRDALVEMQTTADGSRLTKRGEQRLENIKSAVAEQELGFNRIIVEPDQIQENAFDMDDGDYLLRRRFEVNLRSTAEIQEYFQNSQFITFLRGLRARFPRFKVRIVYGIAVKKPRTNNAPYDYNLNGQLHTVIGDADLNEIVKAQYSDFLSGVSMLPTKNSGLVFVALRSVTLYVSQYEPLRGGSYKDLPPDIKAKQCCINIKNNDDKCFLWAVLSALHPPGRDAERVSKYKAFESELNMEGVAYPVKVDSVRRIEELNSAYSFNVYGVDCDSKKSVVFPLYISKHNGRKHIDLLLHDGHYVWVKSLNSLLSIAGKHFSFFCPKCLSGYKSKDRLSEHLSAGLCQPQATRLPTEEKSTISFKNVKNMLTHPCVIYADFESVLLRVNKQASEKVKVLQEHASIAHAMLRVCRDDATMNKFETYTGEDACENFVQSLLDQAEELHEIITTNKPLVMTAADEREFKTAKSCYLCGGELGKDRVRDHNHMTGKYRGAAHNECNIALQMPDYIPVVFHNLKGYDGQFLVRELSKHCDSNDDLSVIATTAEKFLSFTFTYKVYRDDKHYNRVKFRFIDSFQFLSSSLDYLASITPNEQKAFTREAFPDDVQFQLMTRKGFLPYDYLSDHTVLGMPMPPYQEVKKGLLGTVSAEEYAHGLKVWNAFGCRCLGDYMKVYLMADVYLLADVFENFRSVCKEYYGLDPLHYYSLPGLSWDALLKMTKVEVKNITDNDIYDMFEAGKRGGVSFIGHRYAKANNTYMKKYDAKAPSSHLMYFDANNLYGWAMSQKLPIGDYKFVDMDSAAVLAVDAEGDFGYLCEVDLEYPVELHASHSMLPLAPVKAKAPELSAYAAQFGVKSTVAKLLSTLEDKTRYVCHIKNLQQYVAMGMRIKAVHRVVQFKQQDWMKQYIDFNTAKRTVARNDFEKDLFKLMNNSVFGKTIENIRERVNLKVLHKSDKQILKYTAKPNFTGFTTQIGEAIGLKMNKSVVKLDKPIAVGVCVLELSKTLMFDFHYNVMIPRYGAENLKLCMTDTDSLFYWIKTEDVYADMRDMQSHFDMSEYAPSHLNYDTTNKKVLGKFKDEEAMDVITEFVGLRSKLYAYRTDGGSVEKRCKGVKKSVVKDMKFDEYFDVLERSKEGDLATVQKTMNLIRSRNHHLMTLEQTKTALSAFDDKRYLLNAVDSVPYGFHTPK